jgi:O-antigen ligase
VSPLNGSIPRAELTRSLRELPTGGGGMEHSTWVGRVTDVMASTSTRLAASPNWFDSLLFVVLMSGPPKFRERDPFASLAGAIDWVVLLHITVWTCGGLWTIARVYPALVRRGILPAINPAQAIAALFIAALMLSLPESPGRLLTAFTIGQFVVMLGFTWVFTHRFGVSACLRHLFIGASVLGVAIVVALVLSPQLVAGAGIEDTGFVIGQTRVVGNNLADLGEVGLLGLVLCLSSVPRLRGPIFWGALSLFGGLLLISRTRSAYVALLAFLVIGFMQGRGLRVRQLIVPLGAIGFGTFVMDAMTSTTEFLVRDTESIRTLSDRIPLWQHLTSTVMREAPLTGLGYYAASRVYATEYNPGLGTAHSVFFEVLLGGGILGAALYLVLCGSLIWFAVRLLSLATVRSTAVAAVGLLCVALLMGLTEAEAMHAGPLGFAFWSTTALLPLLSRDASRARRAGEQRPHAPTSQPAGRHGSFAAMTRHAQ